MQRENENIEQASPVTNQAATEAPGAANATGDAATVFDERDLLSRLMEDRDLASAIIGCFLEDCPVQLKLLSERLAEADATGARRQAHTIKGAAASVSAVRLRAVGFEMEKAAEAGDLKGASALLPSAAHEFDRFEAALQTAGWVGQSTE